MELPQPITVSTKRNSSFTSSASNIPDQETQSEAGSISELSNNTVVNQYITHHYQFNFQDLEQTIGYLDEKTDIIKWFNDFNDYSILFNWNDLQKCIINKRLLTGLPKLFITSENKNISSWLELKTLLINEFSINTYQLHRMLSERKLGENESLYEYFLKMEEIRSRGAIDFPTFIHYVINGIPDDVQMKCVLYDVKNIYELKEKLKIMSKFQNKLSMNNKRSQKIPVGNQENELLQNNENENIISLNNSCINCGGNGHDRNNCPLKNNQNHTSTSQTINNLSQENIQQITAMILPYFTNTMDELKSALKENSAKLTNTKIEVERLSELTSRHTITLASLSKRLQILEDKEKTVAGFLAGAQLKQKLEPSNDKNLLKVEEIVSKNDEKNTLVKKEKKEELNLVKSDDSDSSDGDDSGTEKRPQRKVERFISDATNLLEGFSQFLSNLDV